MRRTLRAIGLVTVLWLAWRRPFRVVVEGESMAPTLRPGDLLLCARAERIRRGDLVVLRPRSHGFEMVKRVAGLPGEGDLQVGEYLVVGDNPTASTDGRSFGPIRRGDIVGVVLLRYLPRPALLRS